MLLSFNANNLNADYHLLSFFIISLVYSMLNKSVFIDDGPLFKNFDYDFIFCFLYYYYFYYLSQTYQQNVQIV